MMKPVFQRQFRTPSSEQYQLLQDDQPLGHLDLHFGVREVFGTLLLDRELDEDAISDLIDQITEDLVDSTDVPREEFLIRVYVGREIEFYSEDLAGGGEIAIDGYGELDEE